MANFNKVFLMGRLTRDPELRYTPSGTAVTDFGLAVNRTYKTPEGEQKEMTTFVDVTVWGRRAEVCAEYLSKGKPVFIEGRLELDSWETQDGQKRSKLKVVADNFQFIGAPGGGKRDGAATGRGPSPSGAGSAAPPEETDDKLGLPSDDQVPF